MSRIYFYVAPGSDGWQVKSRGFAWDCDTRQLAMDFAVSMAKDYSEATGEQTCIRLQPEEEDEFPFQTGFGNEAGRNASLAFDRGIQVPLQSPGI